ncbi:carboxypeptidase cpdS precursor [Pseudomassariella vexata]|uniref:Carboxypeptidase n=1 Tax=Pseudomassariella vexata TaxID=1141098 RepID=A0A1Y2EBN5_9PEZI|nr:carboxypeptidase cpdS precursor [Pseudomassariella vexata]ORY68989.1 carboxypeptidase cpdS precursor [Pseudomassariella vexata]
MHWSTVVASLVTVAAVTEARSWQHVGRKPPVSSPNAGDYLTHFLETRETADSKFANANTTDFAVNGTGIPDVDFDIGESYSGLLSITDDPDGDQKLFFWFFPSPNDAADKEILLWLNGGPGCSSFEGLIQENGPFIWQYGTYKPVPNPWSWHRLTNIVYVEQPVGTGFSQGTVTATSEEDVAEQFMGFWKNFVDTFSMQGYKVYIAGESYAGKYCPYIASAMLDADDATYYNVSGMMIYDPVLMDDTLQTSYSVVPFVDYNKNLMPFNDSFSAYLQEKHESCGFAEYSATYLQYPPPGPQPGVNVSDECANLWYSVYSEVFSLNPCFDVYQVATTCPLLWDVLGFPGSLYYIPEGANVYFDREDVKQAIHAPNITWEECASNDVFINNHDKSDPSGYKVLPHVIEATQNVIIGHGILDMILLANGSLLSIQNMTWGGKLGFESVPIEPFYVPYHELSTGDAIGESDDMLALSTLAGAGVMGIAHTERGLTYVTVNIAGHMIPQYAPSAAFRQLEFLLGRVEGLSSTQAFTTDKDTPQPSADSLGNGTGPWTWSSTGH